MGAWLKKLDVAVGLGRLRVPYAICELHMNLPSKSMLTSPCKLAKLRQNR